VFERYYEVVNVIVKPLGSGKSIIDNGPVTSVDTVYLDYTFNDKCVAQKIPDLSFLVNSAYACSCKGCGYDGLKNKLSMFQISSDTIYNGIPANQSLNALFKVKRSYYLNDDYSIDSLFKAVNQGYRQLNALTLFTKIKPGNNGRHRFKLIMSFANGSTVSVATNPIRWQ
jgi:hypothetical protein